MLYKSVSTETLLDIDWAALIDQLGGYEAVYQELGYVRFQPRAVYLWQNRNAVPGKYVPVLIALAYKAKLISKVEDLPRINPFKDPDT